MKPTHQLHFDGYDEDPRMVALRRAKAKLALERQQKRRRGGPLE